MDVQIRKVKATKSVIVQVPIARIEDICYHKQVLGYCVFPPAGKTPALKWILFYNKRGELRKFAHHSGRTVKHTEKGPKVILTFHRSLPREFQFLNVVETEFFTEKMDELINKALKEGQFYY